MYCARALDQQPADSMVIATLEHRWLQTSDTTVLGGILAPSFVHIVPGGGFLTRGQHLAWVATHPHQQGVHRSFGGLDVRLYGDAGIPNGTVVATDTAGRELLRSAFTDAFAKRGRRWLAVNAQEDMVTPRK